MSERDASEKLCAPVPECDLGWVACEQNPCPRHVEYWQKYHSQIPQPPPEAVASEAKPCAHPNPQHSMVPGHWSCPDCGYKQHNPEGGSEAKPPMLEVPAHRPALEKEES